MNQLKFLPILFSIIFLLQSQSIFSQCSVPSLTTQADVDDFVLNNPNCTETTFDLSIGINSWDTGVSDIHDLSGLSNLERINGRLYIGKVDSLLDLTGLENIKYVKGDLYVDKNPILRNLSALGNIDTIEGNFFVKVNDSLETIAEFKNLTHIGGYIEIGFNRNMKTLGSFHGITKANTHLDLTTMPLVEELSAFKNITSINGRLSIEKTGITNFNGLNSLTEIRGTYGYMNLRSNPNLTSLDGLNNLEFIDGFLSVVISPQLTSISALENLVIIPDFLRISKTGLENLNGLQNAQVGHNIQILDNDNLISLNGLNVEPVIEEDLIIESNENLTDISALNMIDTIYGDLEVVWNSSLMDCSVLCPTLSFGHIGGSISISGNSNGCNTPEEITDVLCTSNLIEKTPNNYSLYPNPVSEYLTLKSSNQNDMNQKPFISDLLGNRYSITGNKSSNDELVIDVSQLNSGIYYIHLGSSFQPSRFVKL